MNHAAFSPDGRRVVTACGETGLGLSQDPMARVWDAESGQPLTPPLKHKKFVVHAAFSPDGRRVVTASDDQYSAASGTPNRDSPLHRRWNLWGNRTTPHSARTVDVSSPPVATRRRASGTPRSATTENRMTGFVSLRCSAERGSTGMASSSRSLQRNSTTPGKNSERNTPAISLPHPGSPGLASSRGRRLRGIPALGRGPRASRSPDRSRAGSVVAPHAAGTGLRTAWPVGGSCCGPHESARAIPAVCDAPDRPRRRIRRAGPV